MKSIILKFLPAIDFLLLPLVYPSAWLLKSIRRLGIQKFPQCKDAFMKIGMFPIQNHYYEPQFNHQKLKQPLSQDRALPGVDWNVSTQLSRLASLNYSQELSNVFTVKRSELDFHFGKALLHK